jgi:hypothetical protein
VFTGHDGRRLTRQAIDKRLRTVSRQGSGAAAPPVETGTKCPRDVALLTCNWFAALRRSNLCWFVGRT